MDALIAKARFLFHKELFETNTLTLTSAGVASNADTSSRGSKAIARKIVDILYKGTFLGGNLTTAIKTKTKTGGGVIWGGVRDVEQMKKVEGVQV